MPVQHAQLWQRRGRLRALARATRHKGRPPRLMLMIPAHATKLNHRRAITALSQHYLTCSLNFSTHQPPELKVQWHKTKVLPFRPPTVLGGTGVRHILSPPHRHRAAAAAGSSAHTTPL
jgi:hypothetical protein